MSSHHDVIVVGIGSMGAAACLHLAKRGTKVLGIDSQPVPNTHSSYNGNTRVIRLTYQEHPDYVPLLKEAYRLWGEIEQETKARLLIDGIDLPQKVWDDIADVAAELDVAMPSL